MLSTVTPSRSTPPVSSGLLPVAGGPSPDR
jgi:hypothetical protein